MPVCLQFGTEREGNGARASRIENSPAAGGRDTRTLFGGRRGQKAFWCHGGENERAFVPLKRRLALVPVLPYSTLFVVMVVASYKMLPYLRSFSTV